MEPKQRPRVSVIIPALNEEATIAAAIQSASGCGVEVVVVDGGSTDRTMTLAAENGTTVLRARRGRARQMNAGAAAAQGEVLLFLHADTILPPGFDSVVLDALEHPRVCLCAFRLSIEARGWSFRVIEKLANLRSRVLRMPYGDQALSMRACVFQEMGGFPDMPIMEDYALVRDLRRAGRVAVLPLAVVTSARRWLLRGVWWTTLINQLCIAAYRIGVSPTRIARWREGSGGTGIRDSHPAFRALPHDAGRDSRGRGCEKGFSHQQEGFSHQQGEALLDQAQTANPHMGWVKS